MIRKAKELASRFWLWLLALCTGAAIGLLLLARIAGFGRTPRPNLPNAGAGADGRAEAERRRLEVEAQAEAAKAEAAKEEIRAMDAAHVAEEWNRLRKGSDNG